MKVFLDRTGRMVLLIIAAAACVLAVGAFFYGLAYSVGGTNSDDDTSWLWLILMSSGSQ